MSWTLIRCECETLEVDEETKYKHSAASEPLKLLSSVLEDSEKLQLQLAIICHFKGGEYLKFSIFMSKTLLHLAWVLNQQICEEGFAAMVTRCFIKKQMGQQISLAGHRF